MNGSSVFTPKINREDVQVVQSTAPKTVKRDSVSEMLQKVAQYAVLLLIGLLPVFFVPGLWASLGFDKALLTVGASVVVVICVGLLTLRKKIGRTVLPVPVALIWSVVLFALISALLSGDVQDAIRGSVLETQTVGFLGVLALAVTIPLVFQGAKNMSVKMLAFFGITSAVLLAYNLIRLLAGPGILAFGSFGSVTVSPLGGFNDLAIFAGLIVILGLITLAQLPLKAWLQYGVVGIVMLALCILAAVNFFNIWIIVGFFGLLLFVYLVSRDTLFASDADQTPNTIPRSLIITTLIVCVVSAFFIIAGEYAGAKMTQLTGVNYVEVRPSFGATLDITGSVYRENVLLGVGPNRFADAWRLHKDPEINQTIFWSTNFSAGNGYVPTLFVTLGVLGSLAIIAFFLSFIYTGYRMLLRTTSPDFYWYYFALVSFAAAVFLWSMSFIYVPGAGVLLLAALFTGCSLVAYGALVPQAVKAIPLATNKQRGFFLMATIIGVISGSVAVLFSVGSQYVAQAQFTESRATLTDVVAFEQMALDSFGVYPDDRFLSARAQVSLAKVNTLLAGDTQSEEVAQQLAAAINEALQFALAAVNEDQTNPENLALLANVYSTYAILGEPAAPELAKSTLQKAQALDPLNPSYNFLGAQLAVGLNDAETARAEIAAALNLKRNFTEALFLSAQLDINEGNTEAAIATVRSIITLEPNNPTRYFQLGVLLSSSEELDEAILAFQSALRIDQNYANARYFLALSLLEKNETQAALEQLKIVQQTNAENEQLAELIRQVEGGQFVPAQRAALPAPVSDSVPGTGPEDTVVTTQDVESDLITPVNTISNSNDTANDTSISEVDNGAATESGPQSDETSSEPATE